MSMTGNETELSGTAAVDHPRLGPIRGRILKRFDDGRVQILFAGSIPITGQAMTLGDLIGYGAKKG